MKIPAKLKKALATLRKEFDLSPSDIDTLLGNTVPLDRINKFENASAEDDYLATFYLELFSLIIYYRPFFEVYDDDFYYSPDGEILDRQPSPFKKN